jgi:bifunctional DNA-binding transcriptional regulator/antitoxin component of YhaV-PrlF toxin-antitoxin module
MSWLSGPHPISAQYQVKIPTKLAQDLHLRRGDLYFWRRSDDDPAVLTLLPAEVVERRYSAGEQAEAARRPRGSTLDLDEPESTNTVQLPSPP